MSFLMLMATADVINYLLHKMLEIDPFMKVDMSYELLNLIVGMDP